MFVFFRTYFCDDLNIKHVKNGCFYRFKYKTTSDDRPSRNTKWIYFTPSLDMLFKVYLGLHCNINVTLKRYCSILQKSESNVTKESSIYPMKVVEQAKYRMKFKNIKDPHFLNVSTYTTILLYSWVFRQYKVLSPVNS